METKTYTAENGKLIVTTKQVDIIEEHSLDELLSQKNELIRVRDSWQEKINDLDILIAKAKENGL